MRPVAARRALTGSAGRRIARLCAGMHHRNDHLGKAPARRCADPPVIPSARQLHLDAVSRQIELQPDVSGVQLDDYAVLVLQVRGRAATGYGHSDRQRDVVAVEIGKVFEVIHVPGSGNVRRTNIDKRDAGDLEGVRLTAVVQFSVSP